MPYQRHGVAKQTRAIAVSIEKKRKTTTVYVPVYNRILMLIS